MSPLRQASNRSAQLRSSFMRTIHPCWILYSQSVVWSKSPLFMKNNWKISPGMPVFISILDFSSYTKVSPVKRLTVHTSSHGSVTKIWNFWSDVIFESGFPNHHEAVWYLLWDPAGRVPNSCLRPGASSIVTQVNAVHWKTKEQKGARWNPNVTLPTPR